MNRIHRTLLAALTASLGFAAFACGGSAQMSPSSPPPPSGAKSGGDASGSALSYEAPASAQGAPMQPGAAPSPPPAAGASADRASSQREVPHKSEVAPEPTERPGLGTQWGETRSSKINTVAFIRADASNPISTAALMYNDEEGARAMSSGSGFRRTPSGSFTIAHGSVSVGLRDESGSFLTGFVSGGRDFVVGEAGRRYTIVLKNMTGQRFECVVSVDGLDVLDGKDASFQKRGYLLDPHAELEIDGFRQSVDAVAAFRFGSVRGSYANEKHGDTRNVGVIGVAIFNERGSSPTPWTQDEVDRRNNADPFPGRFAAPPVR